MMKIDLSYFQLVGEIVGILFSIYLIWLGLNAIMNYLKTKTKTRPKYYFVSFNHGNGFGSSLIEIHTEYFNKRDFQLTMKKQFTADFEVINYKRISKREFMSNKSDG